MLTELVYWVKQERQITLQIIQDIPDRQISRRVGLCTGQCSAVFVNLRLLGGYGDPPYRILIQSTYHCFKLNPLFSREQYLEGWVCRQNFLCYRKHKAWGIGHREKGRKR